jgi:hypothetical protein
MRHRLADITTGIRGTMRYIECPICHRTFRGPRHNALAIASKLRGLLNEHMKQEHPDAAAA